MQEIAFGEFLRPNKRAYALGPTEDANLVGMRLYGVGPFHREFKPAIRIQKKSHFVIRANDVIYNKLFAWKGTFGVVPQELDGMFVSDKFPTYELDTDRVHLGYLRWYFKNPALWEQARKMSVGSAALSKLTLNPPRFLELTMPCPSVDDQKRMANKLDDISNCITRCQILRTETVGEISALLAARLHEMSNCFKNIGQFEKVLEGKPRNGWSARCDNAEFGTPVLTLSAITGFEFNQTMFKRTSLTTKVDAHYWVRKGDFLMTRSNTPKLVGHAAIADGQPDPCIYPDLIMRVPLNEDLVDKTFAWLWMQTPLVRRFIMANAKGTSPTMKKISQGTVQSIPFPIGVGLDQQRRLVASFSQLIRQVNRIKGTQRKTLAELDALVPSLVDKVFKGEPCR